MTELQKLRVKSLATVKLAEYEAQFIRDMRASPAATISRRQAEWLSKLSWKYRAHIGKELVPAQNPYELMPPSRQGNRWRFYCFDCKAEEFIDRHDDPTTSSGSCPVCGGRKYQITDETGKKIA